MKKKKEQLGYQFQTKEIKRDKILNDDSRRAISFLIVLIIIGGLLAVLFFINAKFVTKDHFQSSTTTTTKAQTIDDTLTTIDGMFKIKDKEYYVLAYDPSDAKIGFLYSNAAYYYKNDKIKLYRVDLKDQMNKNYYDVDGKENKKPTSVKDIVITRPVLLTFKNGKITSYETNEDKILELLKKTN